MSVTIEARRLNGTDLGRTLGNLGVLEQVTHGTMKGEIREDNGDLTLTEFKAVQIKTNTGQYALTPSTKITITGKRSSTEKQ
ncbi:hypothetical protein [Glutamicibacter sp. ZJUTW]|uniref:hypothetical protein n=1 Tax=Glutamicibacter sp. ZJUTW TaxID=1155384 RepID=UPI0011F26416|nr:hypothetical protein [Glutamicibacter sp. ZJUTW]QEP08756.1 hypothetical protein F0M17_16725 [Glutamicibacter sp. ZJUTW]